MTTIESNHVEVAAKQLEVFEFLKDLRNLHELLPQDKVSEFQADENQCSFKVMGAYTIGLEHYSEDAPSNLVLKSKDGAPFSFDLDIKIDELNDQSKVHLVSQADINPFMKMMVEKPLRNLFNYIADQLHKKYQ